MRFASNFATRNLGRVAALLTPRFFKRDPLDCCCDDGAPPADAAPAPAAADSAPRETAALVRHIVGRYHDAHRRELPELIRLARRVEAAHGGHPEAPIGLADLLSRVFSEVEQHLRKEEEGLFPRILAGETDLAAAIGIMRDEHDDHSKRLRQIGTLTRAHTPPQDACKTWKALYAGTRKLTDDLAAHIALENDVLFPRFAGGIAE